MTPRSLKYDQIVFEQTARAVGVAFCSVAWGFAPDDLRAAQVKPIIKDPKELLDLVSIARDHLSGA